MGKRATLPIRGMRASPIQEDAAPQADITVDIGNDNLYPRAPRPAAAAAPSARSPGTAAAPARPSHGKVADYESFFGSAD